MLNNLWGAMILAGVIFGVFSGQPAALTEGVLSGTKDAVSLCITMAGVVGLWMGLMEIAKNRKCLAKGGEYDLEKASILLLDEFRSGKIGYITLEFPEDSDS